MKQKWNCCTSVPDSPDDPHSPTEPRCLMSLCRHKARTKSNMPAIEQRNRRTHGHWSSAKIRVLFRVLSNLGNSRKRSNFNPTKSNQVVPLPGEQLPEPVQMVNNLIPTPVNSSRRVILPALPPPPRRRIITETELANALTILQQQQRNGDRRQLSQYRRRRRSIGQRQKTPALSPIRESGLSNPASPSRQNCTVATITGPCTRPF